MVGVEGFVGLKGGGKLGLRTNAETGGFVDTANVALFDAEALGGGGIGILKASGDAIADFVFERSKAGGILFDFWSGVDEVTSDSNMPQSSLEVVLVLPEDTEGCWVFLNADQSSKPFEAIVDGFVSAVVVVVVDIDDRLLTVATRGDEDVDPTEEKPGVVGVIGVIVFGDAVIGGSRGDGRAVVIPFLTSLSALPQPNFNACGDATTLFGPVKLPLTTPISL